MSELELPFIFSVASQCIPAVLRFFHSRARWDLWLRVISNSRDCDSGRVGMMVSLHIRQLMRSEFAAIGSASCNLVFLPQENQAKDRQDQDNGLYPFLAR